MTWQPAAIVHPDIELVCSQDMRALLVAAGESDVFVSNRVPNPRRNRMVIFNRDGGGGQSVLDLPRVRCRVWDTTDQKANNLAALVAALMQQMADGDPVVSVARESGPFDVPDESGAPQKYLLFSLRTRGSQLDDDLDDDES